MTEYDNTNRGAIWKNDKKETDRHPDFNGSINIEGVEYFLSGWKRAADANPKAPLVKFSVTKKEQQQAHAMPAPSGIGAMPAFEDDIPF